MAHLTVRCIVKGTTVGRLALPTPAVAVTTADQAEISLQQTVILSEERRFSVLWLGIPPLKISLCTSVPACKTPLRKRQRGLAIPAPKAAFVSFAQPVEETEVIEVTITEDMVLGTTIGRLALPSPEVAAVPAHPTGSGSYSLGVFLFSPEWLLVHRRVTPSIKFAGTWWREPLRRLSVFAQKHNIMSPVRAWINSHRSMPETSALTKRRTRCGVENKACI